MAQQADYWNHNVHYQPVILNAVPAGCRSALDVGCGDGILVRRLAVVGLGKDRPPVDWIIGSAGFPVNNYYKLTRGESGPGAPIMGPDMTWTEVRRTARRALPGARYRRRLLWRYSIVWDKPA